MIPHIDINCRYALDSGLNAEDIGFRQCGQSFLYIVRSCPFSDLLLGVLGAAQTMHPDDTSHLSPARKKYLDEFRALYLSRPIHNTPSQRAAIEAVLSEIRAPKSNRERISFVESLNRFVTSELGKHLTHKSTRSASRDALNQECDQLAESLGIMAISESYMSLLKATSKSTEGKKKGKKL